MVGLGLIRINLTMTIDGEQMLLDFTGTAPQVRAALNLPTHGKHGHWMLITGLVNWICTQEPNIAYNAGLVRPMKVKVEKGSILDPGPGGGLRDALLHLAQSVRRYHRGARPGGARGAPRDRFGAGRDPARRGLLDGT